MSWSSSQTNLSSKHYHAGKNYKLQKIYKFKICCESAYDAMRQDGQQQQQAKPTTQRGDR